MEHRGRIAPQKTWKEVEESGPSRRHVRIDCRSPDDHVAVKAINPTMRMIMQRDVRTDDEGRLLRVSKQLSPFLTREQAVVLVRLCPEPMCSRLVVIRDEPLETGAQISFTKYDHLVEAFPPNRSDHPFNICSLPRRSRV